MLRLLNRAAKTIYCLNHKLYKMKKASLTYDPYRQGFKALNEMEGSGQRFYPSKGGKSRVNCRPAKTEEIELALHELGIADLNALKPEQIKVVGNKFYNEICQANNSLAWDEDTNTGFCYFEPITDGE